MVKILRTTSTNFAILSEQEGCNAEWMRLAGVECLHQMQAEQNAKAL